MRRRDLEPRRHGDALRRDPARPGLDVDDDQRAGDHPLLLLHRRRREAGGGLDEAPRHDPERHPEGVHGAARLGAIPIEPALRLIVDGFEWSATHAPLWNTISISGYHIREAGATAAQELAFTLADGFTYVERGIARGLKVDDFAPRLSFFWDIHNDFFEEIAKLRAARRIWARHMKERYGAKDPRSWMMRFHSQTAGVTLTAQQPMNNIVRVAYQALAAVLGGTQSLHTNSMDETLALPTEHSVQVALRTQQVLAYETGVPNVIDPLGGSYYVESLTDKLEARGRGALRGDRAAGRRGARARDRLAAAQDRRERGAPAVGDRAAPPRDRRRERVRHRGGRAHASRCSRSASRREREQRARMSEMRATRDNGLVHAPARRAPRGGEDERESGAAHPRLRARLRHAVRDPRRAWRTCSARIASRSSSRDRAVPAPREWWQSHFDRQYLLEYEPLFTLERDRRRGRAAHRGARPSRRAPAFSTSRAARGATRICSPRRASTSTGLDLLRRRSSPRAKRARHRARAALRARRHAHAAARSGRAASTRVVNLFTSFGFFLEPGRRRAGHRRVRARAQAGRRARSGTAGAATASWRASSRATGGRTSDGTMIGHERSFDPLSGVLTVRRRVARARAPRAARRTASASTRRAASPSFAPRRD